MELPPRVIIIAGPNGAGKTTFAEEFLPFEAECPHFVNADNIARGLSPFRPAEMRITAGRLMLDLLEDYAARRVTFALESTLSGTGYARRIEAWKRLGYEVWLFFLSLPDADMAVARVANRVKEGGHDIPEPDIRRRFDRGLRNFHNTYQKLADQAFLYDAQFLPPTLLQADENA